MSMNINESTARDGVTGNSEDLAHPNSTNTKRDESDNWTRSEWFEGWLELARQVGAR